MWCCGASSGGDGWPRNKLGTGTGTQRPRSLLPTRRRCRYGCPQPWARPGPAHGHTEGDANRSLLEFGPAADCPGVGRESRARGTGTSRCLPPRPFQMASRSGDPEVPPDAAAATEAPADFPCKLERRERPLRAAAIVFLSPVTPALPPQSKQPALPGSGLPLAIWMLGAAAGWRVVLRPIAPARSSPGALVSASEQLGSFFIFALKTKTKTKNKRGPCPCLFHGERAGLISLEDGVLWGRGEGNGLRPAPAQDGVGAAGARFGELLDTGGGARGLNYTAWLPDGPAGLSTAQPGCLRGAQPNFRPVPRPPEPLGGPPGPPAPSPCPPALCVLKQCSRVGFPLCGIPSGSSARISALLCCGADSPQLLRCAWQTQK